MSDIDWFFRSPRSDPRPGEKFSQLYLLRRDIDTCFGIDPNTGRFLRIVDSVTGGDITCQAIWPGTMAILAGIDLLGKILSGSDQMGKGGKRFINFGMRYLNLTRDDADLLYQLRNSLLHSFGLYTEKTERGKVTATYNFVLSRGMGMLIKHLGNDYYCIDAQRLRELFEQALEKYEMELRDTSHHDYQDLNKKFSVMLSKHAKPMFVFSI